MTKITRSKEVEDEDGGGENIVEFFECTCIAETPKAILVKLPEVPQAVWFPQSQIHANSEVWKEGDEGTLVVKRWIAERKGLA